MQRRSNDKVINYSRREFAKMTGAASSRNGRWIKQATSQAQLESGRTDGGWGWAKGGFVRGSYFNGGIVSLRRR